MIKKEEMERINKTKKLEQLYLNCVEELESIGLNLNYKEVGTICIQLSKRNNKRYG